MDSGASLPSVAEQFCPVSRRWQRTGSRANLFAALCERLEVTSIDHIISACRQFHRLLDTTESNLEDTDESELVGIWVLDESEAFRQVPVHSQSRKLAIVTLWDPIKQKEAFLVMIDHPFALTALVMTYNRRAVALTRIIQRFFRIPALSFFYDRFGVARRSLLKLDSDLISKLCHLMGVQLRPPGSCFRSPTRHHLS